MEGGRGDHAVGHVGDEPGGDTLHGLGDVQVERCREESRVGSLQCVEQQVEERPGNPPLFDEIDEVSVTVTTETWTGSPATIAPRIAASATDESLGEFSRYQMTA